MQRPKEQQQRLSSWAINSLSPCQFSLARCAVSGSASTWKGGAVLRRFSFSVYSSWHSETNCWHIVDKLWLKILFCGKILFCWQIVAQNIILWQKYYFVDKLRLTHAPSSSSEDCVVHFWSSVRSWDGYFYFINTTLTDIAQSFFNIECQTEWFIYLFGALNLCAISYWHIDIGFSQIQFELKIWLQPPAVDEKVHWSTDPQKQMVEAHLKSKTLMTL